jgi:hypothetical protein
LIWTGAEPKRQNTQKRVEHLTGGREREPEAFIIHFIFSGLKTCPE